MKNILVFDLDGTLLDDSGKPHPTNVKELLKIRENYPEIKLVFATGTGPERAMKYVKQCNSLIDYLISYNGGITIDLKNKKEIDRKVLLQKQLKDLLEITKKYDNGTLQIYDLNHQKILGIEDIKKFYELNKTKNASQELFYKGLLIFSYDENTIDSIILQLKKDYPDFEISRSKLSKTHQYYSINTNAIGIEINPTGIDKGDAIKKLCDLINVNPNQLIVFGDEMNDETMFKMANTYGGTSVAMGNANPKIKQLASFISDTNVNAGVAKAIEHFIFSENQSFSNEFTAIVNNWETLFNDKIKNEECKLSYK